MTDVIDPVEVMAQSLDPEAWYIDLGMGMRKAAARSKIRRALTAAEAAGMVWVPKVPTEAMIGAGADAVVAVYESQVSDIYAAMLSARPSLTGPEQATRELTDIQKERDAQ